MISPSNTYEALTRPPASAPLYPDGVRSYTRIVALNSAQGAGSAQLAKRLGARRAVVLHEDLRDDYVRTLAEEFDTTARTLGLETARIPWPVSKSYSNLAALVAAAQPDVVYLAGLTREQRQEARRGSPSSASGGASSSSRPTVLRTATSRRRSATPVRACS